MAVARLRCDTDISEMFHTIDTIIYDHENTQLRSVVPPTNPEQAISSVFRPDIQLGHNWQQSTTKKTVAQLRCISGSSEVFRIVDIVI